MSHLARTTTVTFVALAIVLGLLLVFLPASPPAADGQALVIDNAHWFDGERMQPPAAVVVRDGRIAAIEAPGAGPADARRIDATDQTLLPGLIDAHVHTFATARRDALRFGVTTLIDMFTAPALLGPARSERDGYDPTDQAALFSAGMLATAAGGHGTQYGVPVEPLAGPEEAPAWVDRRLAEGSDFIKLVYIPESERLPSLDLETATALIRAAHDRGGLAVAHVSSLAGARDLLEAGIDGFVHVFADRPADEAFIAAAVERGVFVVPTLAVIAMADGQSTGPGVIDDPDLGPRLTPIAKTNLRQDFGARSPWARLPTALDNVRRLHAAGVPILAGSDAVRLTLSGALGRFDERLDAPEGLIWAETSDAMMGGGSSATLERVARGDGGALRVEAEVTTEFAFPWAGAFLGASAEGIVGDLGGADALAFEVRGTPGDYRLMLFVAGGMGAPPTAEFTVADDWRRVVITLDDVRGFEPDRFTGMAFVTPMRGGTYGFEIDNVRLVP